MNEILEALSDNAERTSSSNLINLCHYIAKNRKERTISATGDCGITFSEHVIC